MKVTLRKDSIEIHFDFEAGAYIAPDMLKRYNSFSLSRWELQGRLESLERQGWKRI